MNKEENDIQRSLGRIESDVKATRRDITETKENIKDLAKKMEILPVIKDKIENHLEHHKIMSNRLFYIMLAVFGAILSYFGWIIKTLK